MLSATLPIERDLQTRPTDWRRWNNTTFDDDGGDELM